MNIYIASNNKGKINEINKCFPKYAIFSQSDIESILNVKIETNENGKTFAENAKIKATGLAKALGSHLKDNDLVIADDSGILIPSLPDALGVYTKRQMLAWCKDQSYDATERDFYNHISNITPPPNNCIFEAVIAVITNGTCKTYTGKIEGVLAKECRGDNGFGFDPIFEFEGKTLAEMTDEEKAKINPRIFAIKQMQKDLKD